MNGLRRIAMAIGGTTVVALVLTLAAPRAAHAVLSALVTVTNTSANPVPVWEVKESRANFITLSFNVDSGGYDQVLPDGSRSAFAIPTGQQFVITDVSWMTICNTTTTCTESAGAPVVFTLGASGPYPFGSYISQAIYSSGAVRLAGGSDSLKSGLVAAQVPAPSILFGGPYGDEIFAVTLRGYLVP